jgi:hypothetical protein
MTPFRRKCQFRVLAAVISVSPLLFYSSSAAQTAVTTYHNDNYRTGWNSTETVLKPANVNASQFGLLATVILDDQVDAQPLVVPGVNITAGSYQGQHDVVYIVTGNNTVYAIDANIGTVLLSNHLGAPVQRPLGCWNNGPNVGITSTPVIDTVGKTLYLIAYLQQTGGPVYQVHALDLGSLSDKITPVVVSASHNLTNGTSFVFNAQVQRQRPALLEANGNIYAGFGSFCDKATASSRGWVLGWNAATLSPLPANQLINTQATSVNNFFLSSIWMSGYGLAADDSGNIVFDTGNSDPSGTTYDGITNIQESVIKLSSDLTTVVDLFTPLNWANLDARDLDFGSGGVMVLPDQPGSTPHLAVAAGKQGNLYFMNEDNLGGYSSTTNNVLATHYIGRCWCGESYFVHSGVARVVTSGGDEIKLFKVVTAPSPALTHTASYTIGTGQNGGFFTSVSSNGSSNQIIWALSRPLSKTQTSMTLYAFNPNPKGGGMTLLFSAVAGQWPNYGGDSNQVPTVANGKVYVASYQQLNIYGLLTEGGAKR